MLLMLLFKSKILNRQQNSKMLTKSNLPFKLNVQGSKLPSGLYIIAFGFNDNGFTNMLNSEL